MICLCLSLKRAVSACYRQHSVGFYFYFFLWVWEERAVLLLTGAHWSVRHCQLQPTSNHSSELTTASHTHTHTIQARHPHKQDIHTERRQNETEDTNGRLWGCFPLSQWWHTELRSSCSPGPTTHRWERSSCSPGSTTQRWKRSSCSPGSTTHRCERSSCSPGQSLQKTPDPKQKLRTRWAPDEPHYTR